MHYCKNCKKVFKEDVCPGCGKKSSREAVKTDWCFLVKKQEMWAGMLADVLTQNEIPFQTEDEVESWITVYTGGVLQVKHFFVPYKYLEKAEDLVDQLFSEQGEEIPEE